MIEFSGKISNSTKSSMNKLFRKANFISSLVAIIVICIPITIGTIFLDKLLALFYILIPLIVVGELLSIPKVMKEDYGPTKVIIDKTIIEIEGQKFYQKRDVEDIKRIEDHGEFYRIIFYFPYKSAHAFCQKNLIVQGTIDEFEEQFSELIVRKEL